MHYCLPAYETLYVNTRLFKNDHSHFIQENNFSFAGVAGINQHIYWQNIVVYYNGVRIWGIAPGELPPEPLPQPVAHPRHGVEFEQRENDYTDLIVPFINDISVEVLSFIQGIYRVTLDTSMVTLDPRAEAFFFWESNEGIFTDIHEYGNDRVSLTFRANQGTNDRNIRLMIGVGDNLGQTDRVVVYLSGNNEITPVQQLVQPVDAQLGRGLLGEVLTIATNPAVFEQNRVTNISFAIGYTDENIISILQDMVNLAPSTTYFSVVSGYSGFSLAGAEATIENLQRLQASTNPNFSMAFSIGNVAKPHEV